MNNILMVPIHLDALFLSTDQSVTEAKADFSRLPYFNGSRDINPDIANISESVLSAVLENQNLMSKKKGQAKKKTTQELVNGGVIREKEKGARQEGRGIFI